MTALPPRSIPECGRSQVAELALVPVTLALTALLAAAGRLTRWHPHWLAAPAAAGLGWMMSAGPATAAWGFAAWPGRLVSYLAHLSGQPGGDAGHVRAAGAASLYAGLGHVQASQLPIALIAAAAQCAVTGWLSGRNHETPWRPGLVAAMRLRFNRAVLAAGRAVTRDGCGLGLDLSTGRLAELSWTEAARGILITGRPAKTVGDLGLAVASAAIRLRKAVLIVDLAAQAGRVTELAASCCVPLTTLSVPGCDISGRDSADPVAASMGLAVRGRGVALVVPGRPGRESARRAVVSLVAMLASMRDLALRADCLVWITGCEAIDTGLLTALVELGPLTGTSIVMSAATGAGADGVRQAAEVVADAQSDAAFTLAARTQRPRTLRNCRAVPITAVSHPWSGSNTADVARVVGTPSRLKRPGAPPSNGQPWVTALRWPGIAGARGELRADLIYLGWRQARSGPEPGPMPDPPAEVTPDEVSPDWVAAQRREHARLSRPARQGLAVSLAVGTVAAVCLLTGLASRALPGSALSSAALALLVAGAVTVAAACGLAITRGNRASSAALRAEEDRVAAFQAVQRSHAAARQRQHAQDCRSWQRRSSAYWRQPQWRPVTLPTSLHRVDIAGGTMAGWTALLTMLAAPRLAAGGEVMVIDLTEGAVAQDLLTLAGQWGLHPLVWVLPRDLPSLDLGAGFAGDVLADMLALTVSAADSFGRAIPGAASSGSDLARDAALLSRVLEVLGDNATMSQLTAALRALAQVGGPRSLLASGELWQEQLTRLAGLFGRGGERLVIDRALAMEAWLRMLAPLASALPMHQRSTLKVAWLDRRAAAVGNALLGSYLVVALTTALRQAPPGRPWQQTVCLLGAERLPGDVLDRLCDAAETVGTGLVLGYRSIPPHVGERLGRGHAAVAFMRLGNAADAKLAAEQLGTEHRFVLSQLTDTVGASVTGTFGDSYTSTVGTADSVSGSRSLTESAGRSRGHGRQAAFAPFADFTGSVSQDATSSTAVSDSRSITEGINSSTSWGISTSRALGTSDSLAASVQRSREFVVDATELQQLPHSAVLVSYAGPEGRRVELADANPAIMTLPTATLNASPGTEL